MKKTSRYTKKKHMKKRKNTPGLKSWSDSETWREQLLELYWWVDFVALCGEDFWDLLSRSPEKLKHKKKVLL